MGPEKFISQMVPITLSLLQKENLRGFLDGGKQEGNEIIKFMLMILPILKKRRRKRHGTK